MEKNVRELGEQLIIKPSLIRPKDFKNSTFNFKTYFKKWNTY
jgi:hypothetical protein